MTREEKERIQQKLHRAADAHLNAYGGNLYYEGVARGLEQAAGIVGKVKCEEEPKWIPCSERVPDDLAEVNVTWVNHDPEQYYDFTKDKPFTASAVYYNGEWYWYSSTCADYLAEYGRNDVDKVDDAIEITAWMPLPKPYKGGEKDE